MKKVTNKTAGVLSAVDLKKPMGKVLYGLLILFLISVTLLAIVPCIWAILTAFKDIDEIYSSVSFFPQKMSFELIKTRISESWRLLDIGVPVLNTIIQSLGSLVVQVIACGFGGYALSKIKPKGAALIFTLVVWTMMMPGQIRMVPNYISYLHFPFAADVGVGINLLDTFWPLWLSAGTDAFSVLLYKNAFDGLSNTYVEAAKLDGCTNYGIFFKIMLPLSTPIFIYQAIGVLSGAWSDFFMPSLIYNKIRVMPLEIHRLSSNPTVKMNTYFMALIFASIPSFLIFFFFQKRILGGITVGGVKG